MFQNITQIVKNKLFFLIILNGKKVKLSPKDNGMILQQKKLSALLRGITSKHYGDFYCLNCLYSFITKNKLESHKKDTKILKFYQHRKSDKATFIIYADLEIIVEKINECKDNPENSSTAKVSEHIPSGFSMSTISSLRSIENKHDVYRGEDCMKKFCESLREHTMKIIDFKKKRMKLLTKEQ